MAHMAIYHSLSIYSAPYRNSNDLFRSRGVRSESLMFFPFLYSHKIYNKHNVCRPTPQIFFLLDHYLKGCTRFFDFKKSCDFFCDFCDFSVISCDFEQGLRKKSVVYPSCSLMGLILKQKVILNLKAQYLLELSSRLHFE